jgi:Predicted membrane protein
MGVINCVCQALRSVLMEAFLISTGLVALAEIGDKTQLLALCLAARFRKPLPIILGILLATLLNHALAGALGTWLSHTISHQTMRWILGISFIAMAAWMLVPDSLDEPKETMRVSACSSRPLSPSS